MILRSLILFSRIYCFAILLQLMRLSSAARSSQKGGHIIEVISSDAGIAHRVSPLMLELCSHVVCMCLCVTTSLVLRIHVHESFAVTLVPRHAHGDFATQFGCDRLRVLDHGCLRLHCLHRLRRLRSNSNVLRQKTRTSQVMQCM